MVLLLSPYGEGTYTEDTAGCRGYSVVPLLFFSQDTVFSKMGVMDRGSGGSSIGVEIGGGLEGAVNGLPKPTIGLLWVRMLYDSVK